LNRLTLLVRTLSRPSLPNMSASIIDALPYYDKQVDDPAARSAAKALIDAELRRTPRPAADDPRLGRDVEVFPHSKSLADLLSKYPNEPIRGIDPSKYSLPQPSENATLEELVEAEKRGRISEGHMALRLENADLLSTYAPNAWLVRNYQLGAELKELEALLATMKERVTEVNRSRRAAQEAVGEHLGRLEGRWQDLVGSTVQLEMACVAMEGEVRALRRKEEELRAEVKVLEELQEE